MRSDASLADRSRAVGLRALNRVAGSELVDRLRLRRPTERLVYGTSKTTIRTATRAGRMFAPVTPEHRNAARQPAGERAERFDLTATEEQRMLRESVRGFAREKLRPAAQAADAGCACPPQLLTQSNELGLTIVGVPEELGGAVARRSAVTAVLIGEALAHGDLGIAVACLSPAAVATVISLWGYPEQQATYLPEFVGEDPPAAALAIAEPRALFNPFELTTTARPHHGSYVLDGVKALVPRAADAELFVVAAALEGRAPALFIVEPGAAGLSVEPEPAMGLRAAATGRLILEGVKVELSARLGDGSAGAYRECVQLSRLGWCALALGGAQAVLDYVIPYVNQRTAFGEPVSHRQAVAFTVADIAIELEGMRLATYRAASRVDQGLRFGREVALARRLCAEHAAAIGSDGVQLLGGHGYVKEHPVERWYRDLRAVGVMEGALLV